MESCNNMIATNQYWKNDSILEWIHSSNYTMAWSIFLIENAILPLHRLQPTPTPALIKKWPLSNTIHTIYMMPTAQIFNPHQLQFINPTLLPPSPSPCQCLRLKFHYHADTHHHFHLQHLHEFFTFHWITINHFVDWAAFWSPKFHYITAISHLTVDKILQIRERFFSPTNLKNCHWFTTITIINITIPTFLSTLHHNHNNQNSPYNNFITTNRS